MKSELSSQRTAVWNPIALPVGTELTRRNCQHIYFTGLLVYCVLVLANATLILPLKAFLMFTLVGSNVIIALAIMKLDNKRNAELKKELGRHIDVPTVVEQYPVEISLYTGGILTGHDQGWICFLKEFMVFQGRRTSFNLLSNDVKLRGSAFTEFVGDPSPKKHFTRSLGDRLTWFNGTVRQQMTITGLERYEGPFGRDPIDLGVREWMAMSAATDTHSTFPPLTPNEEVLAGNRLNLPQASVLMIASLLTWLMSAVTEGALWPTIFLAPVVAYSAYLVIDFYRLSRGASR